MSTSPASPSPPRSPTWLDRLRRGLDRRAWRPPRTLRTTRAGTVYLLVTLGVGLASLNTGNNLLYLVLGFLLSIIVLSGILSEQVVQGLQVRRILPDGVYAREPFPLRYEVRTGLRTAFAVLVKERSTLLTGQAWLPLVTPGEALVVRADATALRRGPLRLDEVEVTTAYPFGIFEKTRLLEVEDTLVVYPRRGYACSPPDDAASRHTGESGRARQPDGTGDLRGLKELQEAEDARRVHWVKSAAAGKLLRVERDQEDRKQFTLRLDDGVLGDELERACEETAAASSLLLKEGHEVGLHSGQRHIRPGNGPSHERRLLTALAYAGFEARPERP